MSWITIHDVVHHVSNPDEPGAVAACGQGNRKLDALGVPFWGVEMCATRWEHVTCPACKAKQPLGCKVNITAIKLPESFQGITGNLHALAAVPLSQTNLVWTAIKSDWDPFGAVATVGTVPPVGAGWPGPVVFKDDSHIDYSCLTEEPVPAPEPEQPRRSEGDDLLDFFKGMP